MKGIMKTAEEILKETFKQECKAGMFLAPEDEVKVYEAMKSYAKEYAKEVLEAASRSGRARSFPSIDGKIYFDIDKDSILNTPLPELK